MSEITFERNILESGKKPVKHVSTVESEKIVVFVSEMG